jgi:DNA topoisomerase-1
MSDMWGSLLGFKIGAEVAVPARNRKSGWHVSRPMPTKRKKGPPKLRYSDDAAPGITRKRAGRAWAYFDAKGKRITDRAEIDRLNKVGLPPAYKNAWFCPSANGHILATGIDDKGRKQYRYHPGYRARQDAEKFDGCTDFGKRLAKLRKRVEADLGDRALSRDRAVANVIRLLDLGVVRVGNESYAKANQSFGATTLRRRHAVVSGQTVKLRFKAKSGKLCEVAVTDRRLAHFVRKMDDLPGQHLFQYINGDGEPHPVGSEDVNDYLRETMGGDFTAKNFRTWHASAIGFELLAKAKGQLTIKALSEGVAARLGNTPTIARQSYIHPAVLALVDRQAKWRVKLKMPRKAKWLSAAERGLIDLLEKSPSAEELLAA